jgi:hypothetical protein
MLFKAKIRIKPTILKMMKNDKLNVYIPTIYKKNDKK